MHCFVILHYKNISDTLKCINSILALSGSKKIIVVSNSPLSSSDRYRLSKLVDKLIIMNGNVGYAKANNAGVKYALRFNPRFVSVLNNDTYIDCDWLSLCDKIYSETSFDVLGPFIVSPFSSGSVNPYKPLCSVSDVCKELSYQRKLLFIYSHRLLCFLLEVYMGIKHFFRPPKVMENGLVREYNVALHGCALVFSRHYFECYSSCFDEDTFLYHEESFLYQRILRKHLVSVYDPSLVIYHTEGQSLSDMKKYDKLKFRTEEVIRSLVLLKSSLEKEDGYE